MDLSSFKYIPGDQSVERERIDRGIGIDHEQVLVKCRVHTNHVLDLVVNLELQWVHWCVKVDLGLKISYERDGSNT